MTDRTDIAPPPDIAGLVWRRLGKSAHFHLADATPAYMTMWRADGRAMHARGFMVDETVTPPVVIWCDPAGTETIMHRHGAPR